MLDTLSRRASTRQYIDKLCILHIEVSHNTVFTHAMNPNDISRIGRADSPR